MELSAKQNEGNTGRVIGAFGKMSEVLQGAVPRATAPLDPFVLHPAYDSAIEQDDDGWEEDWEDDPDSRRFLSPSSMPAMEAFRPAAPGPIAAVDCGLIHLGETVAGPVIALRAAIVVDAGEEMPAVRMFRTGPLLLPITAQAELLLRIGTDLGQPDCFVELDDTDPSHPCIKRVKGGLANSAKYLADRFRVWWERLAQAEAVTMISGGTLLLDEALILRNRDTPDAFLHTLAAAAARRSSSLIGISKQSRILIGGKSVRFWLDDCKNATGYRHLSPVLASEAREVVGNKTRHDNRAARIFGNVYATRFTPMGATLRMDVKASPGRTDASAIAQLFASSLMVAGYPEILARAHAYCYFSRADVMALQAQACAEYGLDREPMAALTAAFAPFQGAWK